MNLYPIRTLAELTGVPAITLRAWERRYGLLKPQRTPKGHRLYSTQDIELIKNVVNLLNQNLSISEAVRRIKQGPETTTTASHEAADDWNRMQQRLLAQVEAFNEEALDSLYNQALSLYPIDLVTEHVILPVLDILGNRWTERESGIAEEHFFTAYLRNKLGARLHHEARRARGQVLLAACLPQEHHELGLLMFCLAALGRGYRIIYLGPDMPLEQIHIAAKKTGAAGVLLSGSTVTNNAALQKALAEVRKQLTIPLMIGGTFSKEHHRMIENLGATSLGIHQATALQQLDIRLPAYPR
ncbi:MAG TPA: MerR family transcriptional regulator [Gammaproteobacteria bacterium]|nr:MerR family transcriptional regulator [Gammaproteobacteria bacterium]